MDGYETTRAIRRREGDERHSVIIAMTAHAMKGDRERCIEAGMDDYLAKPINPDEVFSVIRKWLAWKFSAPTAAAMATPDAEPDKRPSSPVDMQDAMDRFDNEREFFSEMLQQFLQLLPGQLKEIEEALAANDADTVQKTAHNIKGSAGTLSARRLYAIVLKMEEHGRAGDLSGMDELLEELKNEGSLLAQFASSLKAGGT
jgi:two-component system sensor histidine kinase/response regulator